MVRPDEMYRKKSLDNFEIIKLNDLEIYIEKPLLHDGSEFLLVYDGKYKLLLQGEFLSIIKIQ